MSGAAWRYVARAMSIHAHPARSDHELDAIVARAGGILCGRRGQAGRSVAVNYGSAAGELAACVRRVGLADRSELVKLALEGPQSTLAQVVFSLAGAAVAPGGTLHTGAAWWCAQSPERMLVLCEAASGDRLHRQIRGLVARHPVLGGLVARHPVLRICDLSREWGAIAVVGRRAGALLAELEVYGETGDPRAVAPVTARPAGGADVTWLLQSHHCALALMHHRDGPAVWHALQVAGQRFGICAVGQEAVARYALVARSYPDL